MPSPDHLYDKRVTFQQESGVAVDTKGGRTPVWSNIIPRLSCAIQPLSSTTKLEHAKLGMTTTHTMYCKTRIPAGGGGGSPSTTHRTIPDLVKGTQSDHNPISRIKLTENGVTTYYGIDGVTDTLKKNIFSVLTLTERQDDWRND